jgi:hypothetical protein
LLSKVWFWFWFFCSPGTADSPAPVVVTKGSLVLVLGFWSRSHPSWVLLFWPFWCSAGSDQSTN